MIKGKKKGFTLVELLIVMSIMFVFMSMIIPKFSGYRDKANYIKAENVGKQIYTAAMMSYMEAGGQFEKTKLEKSISELIGVLSIANDENIENDVIVEEPESDEVNITLNLESKTYNLKITPESYEFKESEDT